MALATNSTPGSIVLAGDLTGVASAPELRSTGVIAGSYGPVNLVVDSKGRIVWAKTSTWPDIESFIDIGSSVTPGIVQICDGLLVTDGVVSLNAPDATYSSKGLIQIDHSFDALYGNLVANYADTDLLGVVKIGNGLTINATLTTAPIASNSVAGLVKPGTLMAVVDGVLGLNPGDATYSTKGIVQIDNGSLVVSSGVLSVPVATGSEPGSVTVGPNLTMTSDVLSVADATNSVKGVVNSANSANISISAGSINTGSNVPLLNTVTQFGKATGLSMQTVSTGTFTPDLALYNLFDASSQSAITLNAPTNAIAGSDFSIVAHTSAPIGDISYSTQYSLPASITNNSEIAGGVWTGTIFCMVPVSISANATCLISADGRAWVDGGATTLASISGSTFDNTNHAQDRTTKLAGSGANIVVIDTFYNTYSNTTNGGTSWATPSIGFTPTAVAYGNGMFMCAGYSSSLSNPRVAVSSDGVSWSLVSVPSLGTGVKLSEISFAGGYFWILPETGNQVGRSTTGTSWDLITLPTIDTKWVNMLHNGTTYCAVSRTRTGSQAQYYATSSDSTNWSAASTFSQTIIRGFSVVGSYFVGSQLSLFYYTAGGYSIAQMSIVYSTDGVTWNVTSVLQDQAPQHGVIMSNGERWVAVCDYDATNLGYPTNRTPIVRTNTFKRNCTVPVGFKLNATPPQTIVYDPGVYKIDVIYDGSSYLYTFTN